jgi:hypothetical protein
VDGHGLAGARGLVEQIGKKRTSETSAAMLGDESNVDDAVLGRPAREIEPTNRCSGLLDDEELRARIMLLIVRVLGVELRLKERDFLRVGPIRYGELLHARGGIEARKEWKVGVRYRPKAQTCFSRARPAEGRIMFAHVSQRLARSRLPERTAMLPE